jgi:hypothetical protein
MLNRTNRTLSANTNRLNLGTRKLDQNASANIGSLTLRTAHVDHDVVSVRAVHLLYPGFGFGGPSITGPKPMKPAMSEMAGSSPESSWPLRVQASRDQQGQPVALASQPVGTVVVRSGDNGTDRCVPPPRSSAPQLPSRSTLARRCELPRFAGRPARATLVSVAAS